MTTLQWRRADLDLALDGLILKLRATPVGTTRYSTLYRLFRKLADACIAEQRFTIEVEPAEQSKEHDERYQRVVDQVRERRRSR